MNVVIEVLIIMLTFIVFPTHSQPPDFDFMSHFDLPSTGVLKYAVLLEMDNEKKCSGSILDRRWVLTAAQCLYRGGHRVGNNGVNVTAGMVDYKFLFSGGTIKQKIQSDKVIIHQDFVEHKLSKYDLALIRLSEPFNFTPAVDKVIVGVDPWPLGSNRSRPCVSFGFGNIVPGPEVTNSHLKRWNVTALHGKNACPCTLRFQWERLVCLQTKVGEGLCALDVGSGLVCYEGNYSSVKLYGVAHMTMDMYMCRYVKEPLKGCSIIPTISIYMYTCPFVNWIRKYVPGVPIGGDSCEGTRMSGRSLFVFGLLVLYVFRR